MFNYFKKKAFKKQIKGIFDDWELDSACLVARVVGKDNKFALWIGLTPKYFADWKDSKFLLAFSTLEKQLLWEELALKVKKVEADRKKQEVVEKLDEQAKEKIRKEFNITIKL